MDEVALDAAGRKVLEPAIDADAVIDVHHVVAGLKLGERGQYAAAGQCATPTTAAALAEDLFVGDDG